MTEKIRVDITGYVDIDITPELKEILDKYYNTEDVEVWDELLEKIHKCINKELYKKGCRETKILDWDCVKISN